MRYGMFLFDHMQQFYCTLFSNPSLAITGNEILLYYIIIRSALLKQSLLRQRSGKMGAVEPQGMPLKCSSCTYWCGTRVQRGVGLVI